MVSYASVLIVASLLIASNAFKFKDCGSLQGKVRDVTVAGCDNTPRCILKSGTDVVLTVDFVSLVESSSAKAVVHGIIAGVPIPFPLPQSDACQDSGLTCPLQNGVNNTYTTTLPISKSYPKIKVVVRWELKGESGKDLFCIEIPAAIM